MASRSRLDLIFCAGLLKAAFRQGWKRLELRWHFTWIMSFSVLSTRSSTQPHMKRSKFIFRGCAREDGDFKTLSSPVKSYKGPRIVAFLPLVSFTGCFDLGSLFYVQVAGKKSGTVSVPGQIFRELRFVFLRKHSHLEKRQKNNKNKHTHTFTALLAKTI